MQGDDTVLVLGLGNRLLRDDAAGPLAVEQLAMGQLAAGPQTASAASRAVYRDGGTIGLHLLPEIEDAEAFIAVDAATFGAAPGTVRVFEGAEMDRQLGGRKRSAHEVALFDLMAAALLNDRLPRRRALVAVEPQSTELGLEPTPAVAASIPHLCAEVQALLQRWSC